MENNEKTGAFSQLRTFLDGRFSLGDDSAEQTEVVENIRKGIDFRGTNLWILMFAIVIASVGLNVNSTAVIIGAMLISPLMGPILGVGLSLGINDFEMFKRSLRNFVFAVVVSLGVSTLYFLVSPVLTTQSELLARTTPTIWDVLIATFGGLAGIVAQTRRDRTSTVIPGVAIATALMPPICTAGFGLASGNFAYFGGALYLFIINAVFIAFAAFFIVRVLKYEHKQQLDPKRAKRVKMYITVIITVTLIPSVILAWNMVQEAMFKNNAQRFVDKVMVFDGSEIISREYVYSREKCSIEVVLVGENVSHEVLRVMEAQMPQYSLSNTELIVKQNSGSGLDNSQMQNLLLSNVDILAERNRRIASLESTMRKYLKDTVPSEQIASELSTLWPGMRQFAITRTTIYTPSNVKADSTANMQNQSVLVCIISTDNSHLLTLQDKERITQWLSARTRTKNIRLIIEDSGSGSKAPNGSSSGK